MTGRIIEKAIEINASSDKVWRTFTDPVISRQMGGEYASDWKVGSSFGWKGKNGNMLTQGAILQIEHGHLLQHSLFDPLNNSQTVSIITYRFLDDKNNTLLRTTEELQQEITDDQYEASSTGWDFALQAVKAIAEKI